MKRAVLFDFGNTLVRYFRGEQWLEVLRRCMQEASDHVRELGLCGATVDDLWPRVEAERGEKDDNRVRPLADRLGRIFQLPESARGEEADELLCRWWLAPIFAMAYRYDDVLPTLEQLRADGHRTAIVSNTPWGSPGTLWREELERLGLTDSVDVIVFCTDVGWRKPARLIFDRALAQLGVGPDEAIFVGDDPRWDVAGPEAIGMASLLIDRFGDGDGEAIHMLSDVCERV